jgi:hypothetical protein
MRLPKLAALCVAGLAAVLRAQPQPACGRPAEPYAQHAAEVLRAIAASCATPEIARLFNNRARHRELLSELRIMAGVERAGPDDGTARLEAYRIFIALAEALAWRGPPQPADEATIRHLNAAYERATEVAELRLRGYDRVADHRERLLFGD